MKVQSVDGREFVEYEDQKGRKIYTGVERFVDEDEDLSEKIPAEKLPSEIPEKGGPSLKKMSEPPSKEAKEAVTGIKGFKKMPEDKKKSLLEKRIPNVANK